MIQIKVPLRPMAYTRTVTDMLHRLALLGGASGTSASLHATLLPRLPVAGAAVSIVHCVPIRRPFVLGQASDRLDRLPATHLCERRRPCGRLYTYALLGAVAGSAGGAVVQNNARSTRSKRGIAGLGWLGLAFS